MSLVVFISGRGSNLRAILQAPVGAQVSAVISDNPQAAGLAIARHHHKPTHVCDYDAYASRADFEEAINQCVDRYQPQLIALAGFMRILSAAFIHHHNDRIVNIHPSLLPAFPGMNTHQRAIAAATREHGCTVHWVSEVVDAGRIIDHQTVPVHATDDENSLAQRVLEQEHQLYPRVLTQLLAEDTGEIGIFNHGKHGNTRKNNGNV